MNFIDFILSLFVTKIHVDYPTFSDGITVVASSLTRVT